MYEKKLNFKQDIDVRGMRGDEALQAVTYFIDDAILLSLIHILPYLACLFLFGLRFFNGADGVFYAGISFLHQLFRLLFFQSRGRRPQAPQSVTLPFAMGEQKIQVHLQLCLLYTSRCV